MEWMFYGLIEKTEKLMALDFCIDLDCSAASFDSLSAILLASKKAFTNTDSTACIQRRWVHHRFYCSNISLQPPKIQQSRKECMSPTANQPINIYLAQITN
ncbi:unnamed protein product [Caenorhabditis nigoni]